MNKHLIIGKLKIKITSIFFIVFIAISLLYNYNKIIFYRPVGIHVWRNCISASIAQNYYYDGNFLHSRLSALIADKDKSDIVIIEFPIFYYAVSLLYRIFGYHEFLYRLSSVLLGILSLFYLFKLCRILFQDNFYAFVPPVIIFTSNIYTFYLNNFIPETHAMSMSLIGFYFFYRFFIENKYKYFIVSSVFFTFAGLIKTPSLLIYFGLCFCLFIELVFGFKLKGDKKLFDTPIKYIGPLFIVLIIIILWYTYSKVYSIEHKIVVSAVEIRPIWDMVKKDIDFIWLKMTSHFQDGWYHSPRFIYFTCILLIANITFFKKYNRLLNILVFITLFQGILFTILFYYSLGRCDYYQINNLIIPALIVMNFTMFLKYNYSKIFNSVYTKLIISILLILMINDCRKVMKIRYSDWFYRVTYPATESYGTITPYLRSLGIERNNRVYSTPDRTTNHTLYLMNQTGFTDAYVPNKSIKENIEYLIPRGLKYLIIGDPSIYNEDLSPYLDNKIGEYMGIDIYKIQD